MCKFTAILRTSSLLGLLFVTLTLIALTELACHRLQNANKTPHSHQRRQQETRVVQEKYPHVMLVKRDDTAVSANAGPPSISASLSQSDSTEPTVGSSSSSATSASSNKAPPPSVSLSPADGLISTTLYMSVAAYLPVGNGLSSPGTTFYGPVGDGSTSIPTATPTPVSYLPVGSGSTSTTTATPGPIYLPVGEDSSKPPYSPPQSAPTTVYLPVGDASTSTPTSTPGPVYIPVGDATVSPPQSMPSTVYLSVGVSSSTSAPAPAPSIFLSVNKDGPSATPPAQIHPVTFPLGGGPISTTLAQGPPVYLSIGGGSNPTHTTPGAPVSILVGDTSAGQVKGENSGKVSGPTTGVAAGLTYTLGPHGSLILGGLTLQTSSPTTAILKDGQVVVVGQTGDVSVEALLHTGPRRPSIGTAGGVVYSIGPGGVAVVEGHTYKSASPATATLSDGHVLVVGPTGAIAIEGSMPTPTPTTGMIDGVPYTIGIDGMVTIDGHTFETSSPMTTTLDDGHIILVGPKGAVAVANAASTDPPSPTTGTADGVTYTIEPDGALVIESYTFRTSSPTTATLSDGHVLVVSPTGAVSLQDQAPPAEKSQSLSIRDYVIGAFIPTLIAVIFGIPWHILLSAIKEMEPFFQLQRADGAPAEKSFCLSYKASITPISTFNALRNGHFLVWSSGLLSLVILLIPPLSSEAVFIGFINSQQCTITFTSRQNCYPVLSVYPFAARVIEGILAFVAIVVLAILIKLLRRKTGLYANPTSIAGLASLLQDQRVIEDFRRISACWPDNRQIENAFRGYRYRIGAYRDPDGSPSYGLMSVHTNLQTTKIADQKTVSTKHRTYKSVAVDEVLEPLPKPMNRQGTVSSILTHSITIAIFASTIAGLVILVIYYYKNGSLNSFEAFMDNQSFGTNFLFTSLGVLIKVYMTYLDNDLRIHHPYRLMSTHPTPPRYSILSNPPSNPFTGFFHSLTHSNPFSAYISLATLLCEPLIVALATIPFKPTSSFLQFVISTWLTVAILSMILLGLLAILYARWLAWRKRHSTRPQHPTADEKKEVGVHSFKFNEGEARAPETLAEGLWLLCGSHMVGDFRGMACLREKERDEVVRKWGRMYEMGVVKGSDGVERVGIEEAVLGGDE